MDIDTDCPVLRDQPTSAGSSYTNGYLPSRTYNSRSTPQTSRLLRNNYGDSSRQPCQPSDTLMSNSRTSESGDGTFENPRTNVITSQCDNRTGYNFSVRNDDSGSSNIQNNWNNSLNLNVESGLSSLENLSLNETSSSIVFNRPVMHVNSDHNRLQQLRNSKYPNYRTKAQRIQSFVLSISPVQNPNTMSEAGFFAISDQDFVRCFHCGIGLRNWEEDDDPYVEHCRWSPSCQYMKIVKGQAFINAVQDAVRKVQLEEALEQSDTRDGAQAYGSVTYTDITEDGDNNEAYPPKVLKKNPLLCNAAQSVIEMGYLPRVVKKAVDSVMQTHGLEGLTGFRIANFVLDLEAKGERVRIPIQQETQKQIEKSRFSEEAKKKLEQQNREFREKILCVICCEADRSITFLPCGHLVCCAQCAPACNSCAVCRKDIKGTVKVSLC